jgi:hypothetical protein
MVGVVFMYAILLAALIGIPLSVIAVLVRVSILAFGLCFLFVARFFRVCE